MRREPINTSDAICIRLVKTGGGWFGRGSYWQATEGLNGVVILSHDDLETIVTRLQRANPGEPVVILPRGA